MNQYRPLATLIFAVSGLAACWPALAAGDKPESEDDKAFYFVGTAVARNLEMFQLSDEELELVISGLRDAVKGEAIDLDQQVYSARAQQLAERRLSSAAEAEKAGAAAYLEAMAAEDGARVTESGIVIRELVAGTGKSPTAQSTIRADYHGTLRDGSVFDSSVERGEPLEVGLDGVIKCWQEAIPTMKEGGKSKITCPSNLAYGDRPVGSIPAGSALTFVVELIEVVN